MNLADKRYYIQSHLSEINEPAVNELYIKVKALLNESKLIQESEEDIEAGNLISHEAFKKEVCNWRPTK
jgi:predicted transcriptional regulator